MAVELVGIPESLGTTKCYYCQAEQDMGNVIEIFIDYYGEEKSVPCCDNCFSENIGLDA